MVAAIECGYRHIDAATAYGNEAAVGAGLADVLARGIVKREDLFITTKLWVVDTEDVAGALSRSLASLGLTYLDLYLIHWPFQLVKGASFPPPLEARLGYSAERMATIWAAMETEAASGRARAIGVSNMTAKKMATLLQTALVVPAVNQVRGAGEGGWGG